MKRMILAVLAMLAVSTLTKELFSLVGISDVGVWQLEPGIIGFVAACLGGFIARAHFVPIALAVHALVWLVILYILHSIANGQSTYLEIASFNSAAIAFSLTLVALGAYVGQRFSAYRGPKASAAA